MKVTIKDKFNAMFTEEWNQPFSSVRFGDEGEESYAEYIFERRNDFREQTQRPLLRSICEQLKEYGVRFYLYYLEKFNDGYHYVPIFCYDIDLCIGFDKELLFLSVGVTPSKEILYKQNHKHALIFDGSEKNLDIIDLLKKKNIL